MAKRRLSAVWAALLAALATRAPAAVAPRFQLLAPAGPRVFAPPVPAAGLSAPSVAAALPVLPAVSPVLSAAPSAPAAAADAPIPSAPARASAHAVSLAAELAAPETSEAVVKRLPDGQTLKIHVAGRLSVLHASAAQGPAIVDQRVHDVVIVGGGLAGLSAAWHLRDKKIVLLESETAAGGLARQGETRASGITYARGAAYYTEPVDDVKKMYDDIGLTPIDKTAIREPIDSYFYNGELIKDVWSEESLKKLPAGFAAFHKELKRLDGAGYFEFDLPEEIPAEAAFLDKITAAEFLKPYGPELSRFLDSYCQSALGGHLDQISALSFLVFYSGEIVTRYAWPGGTGGASEIMARKLSDSNPGFLRAGSRVREVVNTPEGVRVTYERDGVLHALNARKAVVAAPLKVAARIVPEMPESKRVLIGGMKYADYVVHTIVSAADHFTGGYDTWFPSGFKSFTDVITGRWVETDGYTKTHHGPGILTIYMPLAPPQAAQLTPEHVAGLAEKAVQEARELAPGLASEKELAVESYRWPSSIHLTPPGYLTQIAGQLASPDGHIHYANNNLGSPSFEVALLTGKRAADEIRQSSP